MTSSGAAATGGQSNQEPAGTGGAVAPPPATGGTGDDDLCPYFDPTCNDGPVVVDPPPGEMPPVVDPPDEDFELVWQDDFDTFNESRWRRHDHTFIENASYFSYDNVRIVDGKLQLHLTTNPTFNPNNENDKPYLGAEVSTVELFQYGRITASIRFAQGQGIVSSLFTFADNANEFWNEIDVEYLGYAENEVQYNLITSNCFGCGSDRTATPYPDFLGVAPYLDFYEYEITWTPGTVSFKTGGLPRWSTEAPEMTQPARIRMNVWPTSGVDPFAGTLDPNAVPTMAEYDWIRVERYVPSAN